MVREATQRVLMKKAKMKVNKINTYIYTHYLDAPERKGNWV